MATPAFATHLSFTKHSIKSVLLMKEKKKSREIKYLAQFPTVSKYLNQDLSSSLFAEPKSHLQCQDASQGRGILRSVG